MKYLQHLARRLALPLMPVALCTLCVAVGALSPALYVVVALSAWYTCNAFAVLFPFCVSFPHLQLTCVSRIHICICICASARAGGGVNRSGGAAALG